MTAPELSLTRSWRDLPITRVLGSFVSWFLFALSFTLLFLVMLSVMAIGGYCASGGPYVIAVECPQGAVVFAPLSIFAGLAAVALGAIFAQGFGTPLRSWAWPILFCGLGVGFLAAFFIGGDLTGLLIGIMFELMGLVPLVLELRASAQSALIGSTNAAGVPFTASAKARFSFFGRSTTNQKGTIAANVGNWASSLGILAVAVALGVWLARLWYASV